MEMKKMQMNLIMKIIKIIIETVKIKIKIRIVNLERKKKEAC